MKFFNLLFLAGIAISFNITAMEQQPQAEKRFIEIINMTKDSLEAVVKYYNESDERSLCIEPDQPLVISDLKQIESLCVVKYGRWAQYSNRNYFTFGLIARYNIVQHPNVKELIQLDKSAKVIVRSSGKDIVSKVTSYEQIQRFASYIAPYSYEVSTAEDRTEKKQYKFFLFDFFPRVKRAFRADQPIHERYFLDLPEHANEHSVQNAYERARDFWMNEKENAQDSVKIKLAQDALKFVEIAYKSLTGDKDCVSEFKTLVYNEDRSPTSYFFAEEPEAANAQLPNNNN